MNLAKHTDGYHVLRLCANGQITAGKAAELLTALDRGETVALPPLEVEAPPTYAGVPIVSDPTLPLGHMIAFASYPRRMGSPASRESADKLADAARPSPPAEAVASTAAGTTDTAERSAAQSGQGGGLAAVCHETDDSGATRCADMADAASELRASNANPPPATCPIERALAQADRDHYECSGEHLTSLGATACPVCLTIAAARAEAERLRARVAELEANR